MDVLVTGGAGFIGSTLVRRLLADLEGRVVTLDALTYAGSTANLDGVLDHPRHEFVHGDVRDESLLADCLKTVDAVVHLAAETHVDRSIEDASPFVETNVRGTQTLLDTVRATDIERFVHVSTDEVYGEILDGRVTEQAPLEPRNPYAATKAGADHLVESYQVTHDVPAIVARPTNTYGPRQHAEKAVPTFIERAVAGESLPVYGDGSNAREWLFVEDLARALLVLLREGSIGETYNVTSGVEKTTLEVARVICKELDRPADLIEHVPDRPGHDQRYALDATKIERLGWAPTTTFEEGIRQTIDQYR
ncbi:MAG: dTDP-glucose 4,6-dehydratase [Halococcoides sp.]